MGFLTSYSESHVHRMLWDVACALYRHAFNSVPWPSYEMRCLNSVWYRGQRIVIIFDGFEQPCVAFTDRNVRQAVFSGKYKAVTICRMVGVEPRIFFSPAYEGNYNDNNIIGLRENDVPLRDDECVCVDKGIKSVESLYDMTIVPKFKHRLTGMPDWQKRRNYDVSHYRILVESTISFLKDFNILGMKFRVKGGNDRHKTS